VSFPPGRYIRHGVFVPGLLLSILITAACGGPDTTPTPEGPAQPTSSATQPPAAATTETPTGGQGGPATDQGSLIDTLRKTFPAITPVDTINQPFMSVPATNLKLDGEAFPVVQVYEYQDEAAAKKDAARIQPDGEEIGNNHVGWIAQPHFYRSGRIIVIYLGKDPAILSALESALGKPFIVGREPPFSGTPKP
jgi:hypothetical protein